MVTVLKYWKPESGRKLPKEALELNIYRGTKQGMQGNSDQVEKLTLDQSLKHTI